MEKGEQIGLTPQHVSVGLGLLINISVLPVVGPGNLQAIAFFKGFISLSSPPGEQASHSLRPLMVCPLITIVLPT